MQKWTSLPMKKIKQGIAGALVILMPVFAACEGSHQTPRPSVAMNDDRGPCEAMVGLNVEHLGLDEIVITPIDIKANGEMVVVSVAAGARSSVAARIAAIEYARHAETDVECVSLTRGTTVVPLRLPARESGASYPDPETKIVECTGVAWAVVKVSFMSETSLPAGRYELSIESRDVQMAQPQLDAYSIRFLPSQSVFLQMSR